MLYEDYTWVQHSRHIGSSVPALYVSSELLVYETLSSTPDISDKSIGSSVPDISDKSIGSSVPDVVRKRSTS
jgi:hypothetical protein